MLILSAYGAPALQHRWFFTHPKQQAIFKSCEGRKLQEMIPGNKRRPPVRNPFLKNELPKCSTAESLRKKKKRAPKRVLLFKLNERHSNHPLCWSEWRHRKECHIWSYCWPQIDPSWNPPKKAAANQLFFSMATKKLMNYRSPPPVKRLFASKNEIYVQRDAKGEMMFFFQYTPNAKHGTWQWWFPTRIFFSNG